MVFMRVIHKKRNWKCTSKSVLPQYNKKMLNRFLLCTKNTFWRFFNPSLAKIIVSHKFVVGEGPHEDLNPRRNNNGPNRGNKDRLDPSKVDDAI